MMNRALTWSDIENITGGRFGRTMAVCPLCSANRRTAQKRQSKVLAVELIEADFAVFFCNHCEASGYCRPDRTPRVIDLIEQQKRRNAAQLHAEAEKARRSQQALTLWSEALPFQNSPADHYLRHIRHIGDWLDTFNFGDVIRFHPSCPFGNERLPCMIALVRDIKTDAPVAIHRTALTTELQRIGRMSFGPIGGGAIKLSPDDEVHSGLLIGEGIETVLSASKELQFKPVWSLIDKNGVARFPVLSGIESITVAVDNDKSGDGQRAATECVERLTYGGIEVFTAKPIAKGDFNDVIRAG
jgi:hypothetical protein